MFTDVVKFGEQGREAHKLAKGEQQESEGSNRGTGACDD